MIINEIFGPTFQGEGPSTGRRCGFVRLGRCNLTCSWCDTPYTWDWDGVNGTTYDPAVELRKYSARAVLDAVKEMDVGMAVITGGEPLAQRNSVYEVAVGLQEANIRVEIETNGTISPSAQLLAATDQFNVSIKLTNSGVDERKRIVPDAVAALLTGSSVFKFVATSVDDLDEVAVIQQQFDIDDSAIWILPEGITSQEILVRSSQLASEVLDRKWNLSSRLHVLLWEDTRGV